MKFHKTAGNRDYVLPLGAELSCIVYFVDNWDNRYLLSVLGEVHSYFFLSFCCMNCST